MAEANSSPAGYCRMAIPKKGRLYDVCCEMLKGAGIKFHRGARLDVAVCKGLPLTLVFLPASDIAMYVGEGNVDFGITGFDIVEESEVEVEKMLDLGIGKCKLCVQAQVSKKITNPADFAGKRIVTSFPNLTKKYFDVLDKEKGTKTSIKFVSGSVEAACGLGLADAVVDLVETGTTMRAAGLEVIADVLETEAVLIKNPQTKHADLLNKILRRLEGYMVSTQYVMLVYNIATTLLEKASSAAPGKRSPTITALEDPNFKSVSILVHKKEMSEKMDELHDIGATDILALNLANSRM